MKKFSALILVIMISISTSCENTDSGGGDFALEAAGALAAAGIVMGTQDYGLDSSPPSFLLSVPMRVFMEPENYTYSDGDAGTAIYTPNDNTISFDNFTVIFQSTSYVLDGLITCNNYGDYHYISNEFTFAGDISIEGGNLSGTYTVDLTVSLTLSDSDITATVTGTVDGESVQISLTAN